MIRDVGRIGDVCSMLVGDSGTIETIVLHWAEIVFVLDGKSADGFRLSSVATLLLALTQLQIFEVEEVRQ